MIPFSLASLLARFGYPILFAGTLLEGETVLVLAGFAARRGILDLWLVIIIAAIGGFLGDQLFFWLGRRHKAWLFQKLPKVEKRIAKASGFINRHGHVGVILIRYVYGFRVAGAVAFGVSDFPVRTFVALNFAGAFVWSVLFATIGYFFGSLAERLLGDFKAYEEAMLIAVAVIALAVFAALHWRQKPD
ncbi:MAG: DedA family protein [Rhizobiaceae bacterium]